MCCPACSASPGTLPVFDGPEDYVLPGLFDGPSHVAPVFEPGEGETYFGALSETFEAGDTSEVTPPAG